MHLDESVPLGCTSKALGLLLKSGARNLDGRTSVQDQVCALLNPTSQKHPSRSLCVLHSNWKLPIVGESAPPFSAIIRSSSISRSASINGTAGGRSWVVGTKVFTCVRTGSEPQFLFPSTTDLLLLPTPHFPRPARLRRQDSRALGRGHHGLHLYRDHCQHPPAYGLHLCNPVAPYNYMGQHRLMVRLHLRLLCREAGGHHRGQAGERHLAASHSLWILEAPYSYVASQWQQIAM
jgi:hypothetical protein